MTARVPLQLDLLSTQRRIAEPILKTVERREEEAARSEWCSTAAPECSGFYELRQKSAWTTTSFLRPWFDADKQLWAFSDGSAIGHRILMMSHFWRGLKAPAPEGYTYKVPGQRVRLS